ncbi:discoidin domain-containing protein [Lactobacillus sp. ESL0684]|uniref:TIM-barrel domain-containing protein n=1 Tax=Lactobacillus sp. ESL0684 TaxID=2983213 RepID=UPI0023F78542|nr:TIM-barrel domain-containing protein [Lactobacillus sp. ESL0684]WEV43771.1 discoidin domain-containing protein [Lactobacillus sp. ESL0684]
MIQDIQNPKHQLGSLTGANRCENYYELHYSTGEVARFYILADGIFRFLLDPTKIFEENQTSLIQLANFDQSHFNQSTVRATNDSLIIQAGHYQILFGKEPAIISIFDEELHRTRMAQAKPLELNANQTSEFLVQNKNEFYYGGGLQNGYFGHKGRQIEIKHDQITGKGGVITQTPFFWSNTGYGELRNTNQTGTYDFGVNDHRLTTISHQDRIFDTFYLIGKTTQDILVKYYSLTGKPLMPPKYSLGLGHIGNYETTLWQPSQAKDRNASKIAGNYYTRTQDSTVATKKASLNGEEDYQFSARAMIDRYKKLHFALSWFIPNYNTQPDHEALASFNEYAHSQDVQPGYWHAKETDLPNTTSFTLTNNSAAVTSDNEKLLASLNSKRPLVLNTHGSIGMQSKAAIIFSDIGGNWENITTQVAGLIGASLSGIPFASTAVDGDQGGGNAQINIRDFEWKAFTPLLFNLDDQGEFSKTPFAFNKKITEINQAYLQLRYQFQSYLYTLSYQAQNGATIVGPIFINFPNELVNYTEQFKSEFMLGTNLLIAPITNGREDANGRSRKDNLYLPDQRTMWIDLFTGEKYAGGRVYNHLTYALWHLPVFVRGGSIFDFGQRNFVFYPQGQSSTTIYDDDDLNDFIHNHTETKISSIKSANELTITIDPIQGNYPSLEPEQPTMLTIMCDAYPDQITVKINDQRLSLQEFGTIDAFNHAKEGFFYNSNYSPVPAFNYYQAPKQAALQIKLAARDITTSKFEIIIHNHVYGDNVLVHAITDSLLPSPKLPAVDPSKITAHSFELAWSKTSQVEVEINQILYQGIVGSSFTFHELAPNTRYIIRMRYVMGNKVSEWSDYFGVITKHAASEYAIKDIAVTANFTSEPNHPLQYLTDLKLASEWQTNTVATKEKPLQLTFTFKDIEKLSRMVLVPRNIDHNGNPTDISIAISTDEVNYTTYAEHIHWKADSKNKVVGLRDVRAKSLRLTIHEASGAIVAAKEIEFFRAKK